MTEQDITEENANAFRELWVMLSIGATLTLTNTPPVFTLTIEDYQKYPVKVLGQGMTLNDAIHHAFNTCNNLQGETT